MKTNPGRKERRRFARTVNQKPSSKHMRKPHVFTCPLVNRAEGNTAVGATVMQERRKETP